MSLLSRLVMLAAVATAPLATATAPTAARAYPIDCAILLCMAGGFPPLTECSAAKAEVIRRITPWPVEPPLQLWRCPMGISPEGAALAGITPLPLGPDGLTSEVRAYRDSIEIYHIRYRRVRDREGTVMVTDRTEVGAYGGAGTFTWQGASFAHGPEWLAGAVGGTRTEIRACLRDNDSGCLRYETVGYENRGRHEFTTLRGVALRYRDHTGAIHDEFVRY